MGVDLLSAPGVNKAGDTMSGALAIVQASAATVALSTKVTGDAANRWQVTQDGTVSWGDGTNPVDVSLSRSAANTLLLASGDRFNASFAAVNSTGALGTVEKFRVNTPTTVDNLANTMLSGSAATAIPCVIQSAAAPSARMWEVQSSAGTRLASINSIGTLTVGVATLAPAKLTIDSKDVAESVSGPAGVSACRFAAGYVTAQSPAVWTPNANNAAAVVMTTRGVAGQTANLTQWQDSTPTDHMAVNAAGLLKWMAAGDTQTTVGAAGGASAPPATPTRWLKVVDSDGTVLVIPGYLAA